MTDLPLFLYGTLQDRDILAAVLGQAPSPVQLVAATAPDCAAVYFPDRLYPALVKRAGSVAKGMLLRVTQEDLAALDAFEGDDYVRGAVPVMTAVGPQAAQAYWPAIAVTPSAQDWTLERWTREHKPLVLAREVELARLARRG
jgi:gamma-glutamylcyclotransferase (GGCT)/AIG2-like uncharacterized protein YtfP